MLSAVTVILQRSVFAVRRPCQMVIIAQQVLAVDRAMETPMRISLDGTDKRQALAGVCTVWVQGVAARNAGEWDFVAFELLDIAYPAAIIAQPGDDPGRPVNFPNAYLFHLALSHFSPYRQARHRLSPSERRTRHRRS